jgi:hypothetical protein
MTQNDYSTDVSVGPFRAQEARRMAGRRARF